MVKKPIETTGMLEVERYASNPDESVSTQERDVNNVDPETGERDWLGISRDAFKTSTDYLDANVRKQIERNISSFRNKHAPGSKYYTEAYRSRSKIFRPKTRSVVRRHEAAAAVAFFSTLDTVSCLPEDKRDKEAELGATYGKNWLEYRLEHSIPWFLTAIGAYQDSMVQGIVISRQEWVFSEETEMISEPAYSNGLLKLDGNGLPYNEEREVKKVTQDKPDIVLIPLENFRFSTAADWRDPVGTSPFLIELIPMYIGDVQERMRQPDNKTGEPAWAEYGEGEIQTSQEYYYDYDSTRMARDGKREDPKEETYQMNRFDVVWVHRCIIRVDGVDWLYYTLGTTKLLSKPVPVTDVYQHGRPYAIGSAVIETHRNYASGLPELTQDIQTEANEVANQRLDNVKLVLNKRYKARRGANVDWRALRQSTPGGIVLMDDLNDIKEEAFTDVTASSYEEQGRIDTDFDEMAGSFTSASVQNRRSANDTVGGMSMAMDDSNVVTEYQLRVFAETWVESVLRQLLDMGRKYEDDPRILKLIGEGEEPERVLELMSSSFAVKVAVGFGSTSPHKRIERMSAGLNTIKEIAPDALRRLNSDEVVKEVFGALGYRDGSRFFTIEENVDPQVAQLEQEVQQLTQLLETNQMDNEAKLQITQIKEQAATARQQMQLEIDSQIKYIGEQIKAESNDIARGELQLQQEALEFKKKDREVELLTNERDRMSSVIMNDQYGDVPAAEG